MACEHEVLTFGSGDYYVFCQACAARWGRLASDQPEYGQDKEGRYVGCAPKLAIGQPTGDRRKSPKLVMVEEGPVRHRARGAGLRRMRICRYVSP